MKCNRFLELFWLAAWIGHAQVITVTRTLNNCTVSAPSTSAKSSSYSTSPSIPSSFDQQLNSGVPFTVEILALGSPALVFRRRQTVEATGSWLLANGTLTTDHTAADIFQLVNGQMIVANSFFLESTQPGVSSQLLAASPAADAGSIITTFFVQNAQLAWQNQNFDNQAASFYKVSSLQGEEEEVVALFRGSPENSWENVVLGVQSALQTTGNSSTSVVVEISTTISSGSTTSSMVSTIPGSSSSALSRTGSVHSTQSGSLGGSINSTPSTPISIPATIAPNSSPISQSISRTITQTTASSPTGTSAFALPLSSSEQQSSPALSSTPSSSRSDQPTSPPSPVSTDGTCGVANGNQTCRFSGFGSCCGPYGFCGADVNYCGPGCQASYGTCNPSSPGSSSASSQTFSSPSLSPTGIYLPVSQDGTCGPDMGQTQQTCQGSIFGNCCSIFGLCGNDEFSCVTGCQVGFGQCGPASAASSSSSASSASLSTIGINSSTAATSISAQSSIVTEMSSLRASASSSSMSDSSKFGSSGASSSFPSQPANESKTSSLTSSFVIMTPSRSSLSLPSATPSNSLQILSMTASISSLPRTSLISGSTTTSASLPSDSISTSLGMSSITTTSASSSNQQILSTFTVINSSSIFICTIGPDGPPQCGPLATSTSSSLGALSTRSTSTASPTQQPSTIPTSSSITECQLGTNGPDCQTVTATATQLSTKSATNFIVPTPSAKRGFVRVDTNDIMDNLLFVRPDQPGSPVNWYYNYGYEPSPEFVDNPNIQYVPQLWGDYNSNFTQTVVQMLQSGINVSHVLAFNEPDGTFNTGGSQITPQNAYARWMSDIQPLAAYGVKLGAPAVTGSQGGFAWLAEFFAACNGSCQIDFIPIHWYGSFIGLASEIGQMHGTYPSYPLWITEFADADDTLTSTQSNFQEDISYLDSLPYIVRYSYFGSFRSTVSNVGPNATMLDQCGRLTDIGDWYLNLQPQGNIPDTTSCTLSTTTSTSASASFSTGVFSISSTPAMSRSPLTSSNTNSANLSSSSRINSSPSTAAMHTSGSSEAASTTVILSTAIVTPEPAPASSSNGVSTSSCTTPTNILHLPGTPTAVPGMACVSDLIDDGYGTVELPFSMQLFGVEANVVNPSSNGLFALTDGTIQFFNTPLPASDFNDPSLLGIAFPYWTDLAVWSNSDTQVYGIYYYANTTFAMFEYILAPSCCAVDVFQFSLAYSTLQPAVVAFRYYSLPDTGGSSTIGVQSAQSGDASAQFEYDTPDSVTAGMQVVCNTNAGAYRCSSSTFM